jgi:hypothetical protein
VSEPSGIPRKGGLLIYPRDEVADYRLLEGDEYKALMLLRLQSFIGWTAYPALAPGYLPDDDGLLQRTSSLDPKRWGQVRRAVLSLLTAVPGVGYCCEKVLAAVKSQQQRVDAANARWRANRDAAPHAVSHAGRHAADAGTDAGRHAGADAARDAVTDAGAIREGMREPMRSDMRNGMRGPMREGMRPIPIPGEEPEEDPDAVESAAVAEGLLEDSQPSRNSLEIPPASGLRDSHSSHSATTGARARGRAAGPEGARKGAETLAARGGGE